jgi:hypothetical protein
MKKGLIMLCKYCEKICKNKISLSAHERLCPHNKNRKYVSHTLGKTAWNKGLTKDTSEIILKSSEKLKETINDISFTIKGCCTKEWSLSETGILTNSKNGGYRDHSGTSKKYKVLDSFGNVVTLQSSYELLCSEILNELCIKWVRPSYLKYDDKKYFPDFYLPEINIYLDPKNDYLAKIDFEKIEKVKQQNSVMVFILTKNQLTTDYIRELPKWSNGLD